MGPFGMMQPEGQKVTLGELEPTSESPRLMISGSVHIQRTGSDRACEENST